MDDHHRVERVRDGAAWRAEATPFYEQDALRSTIPMTVLLTPGFDTDPALELFRVYDGAGAACLHAVRKPPFSLLLTLGPPEAAAALGRVRDDLVPGVPLPGVTGPLRLVEAFTDAYQRVTGRVEKTRTELRLHAVERVVEPAAPRGRGRLATGADAAALLVCFEGFARDVHMPPDARLRERLEQGLVDTQIYVWDVDGEIVSVAQHSESASGWSRVRLVYTPPEHRGKGYAAACVALTTKQAMAGGGRACLYTDLSNPTSNALYARLGYVPVEDSREVLFAS